MRRAALLATRRLVDVRALSEDESLYVLECYDDALRRARPAPGRDPEGVMHIAGLRMLCEAAAFAGHPSISTLEAACAPPCAPALDTGRPDLALRPSLKASDGDEAPAWPDSYSVLIARMIGYATGELGFRAIDPGFLAEKLPFRSYELASWRHGRVELAWMRALRTSTPLNDATAEARRQRAAQLYAAELAVLRQPAALDGVDPDDFDIFLEDKTYAAFASVMARVSAEAPADDAAAHELPDEADHGRRLDLSVTRDRLDVLPLLQRLMDDQQDAARRGTPAAKALQATMAHLFATYAPDVSAGRFPSPPLRLPVTPSVTD